MMTIILIWLVFGMVGYVGYIIQYMRQQKKSLKDIYNESVSDPKYAILAFVFAAIAGPISMYGASTVRFNDL